MSISRTATTKPITNSRIKRSCLRLRWVGHGGACSCKVPLLSAGVVAWGRPCLGVCGSIGLQLRGLWRLDLGRSVHPLISVWLLSAYLLVLGAAVDHRIRLRAPAPMAAAVYGIARCSDTSRAVFGPLERRTSGRFPVAPPEYGDLGRFQADPGTLRLGCDQIEADHGYPFCA